MLNQLLGIKYMFSRFANVFAQIKQIQIIFTHLKLWVTVARHNIGCVECYATF